MGGIVLMIQNFQIAISNSIMSLKDAITIKRMGSVSAATIIYQLVWFIPLIIWLCVKY